MSDAEKYGYSPFDDELQMQVKRERWKDAEIERLTEALQQVMECSGTSQKQYHIARDAITDHDGPNTDG